MSFLLTFLVARCLVLLIMTRRLPDLYLYVGGTHVHHLNLGIFLLAGVGAYLLFRRPGDAALGKAAILYGIGLGLTFDEFGMWLHLGGGYWQRASLDAVLLIASSLALFILAPRVKELRPRHWWAAAGLLVMTLVFALLLVDSLRFLGRVVEPRMEHLEESAPGQP